ncbi:KH domain-containing protein [Aphelenchoides bicaudatus]|nr:KH domain-containing protein [Aphelenchoides bicaudatus]
MLSYSPTSPSMVSSTRSPDLVDVQYLNELMSDRTTLEYLPKRFMHLERILDQEIVNVRQRVFDSQAVQKLELPPPFGEPGVYRKKIYIPENGGHFNYVGRLLGPRGKTLKSIEQETGCKLMIRGVGSSRSSPAGSVNRFSPCGSPYSSGHSSQYSQYSPPQYSQYTSPQGYCSTDDNDYLHVQIQCEDTENRADIRINHAVSLIESLFAPVDEANDVLKQKQLLELSLLRGTYFSF